MASLSGFFALLNASQTVLWVAFRGTSSPESPTSGAAFVSSSEGNTLASSDIFSRHSTHDGNGQFLSPRNGFVIADPKNPPLPRPFFFFNEDLPQYGC
uniref:Putative secreted protein n=1 Tax=Anopheles marajoara TaxID=58244 RepID=A0A2M4C923_9DIPT